MDHTPKRQNQPYPEVFLEMAYAQECRNLDRAIGGRGGLLFGSLNVVRRNHGDWLAMCKVTDLATMTKLIAFGAGTSYASALVALDKTIGLAKWKPDKPWESRAKRA